MAGSEELFPPTIKTAMMEATIPTAVMARGKRLPLTGATSSIVTARVMAEIMAPT